MPETVTSNLKFPLMTKFILSGLVTILLPLGAWGLLMLWWSSGFSWDPNYSPPWYVQALFPAAGGLFLAAFVSLALTIVLLFKISKRRRS